MLRAMAHADTLERLHDARLSLCWPHPAVCERQFDVLIDRQVANEVETLKDEPNLAIADACALGRFQARDGLVVQRIGPVGWRIEQAEDRQQR